MTQPFNDNYEREFDWNDTIVKDSEFVTLEPGEYWFTVKGFERARHIPDPQKPGKLPACKKAIVEIEIKTIDGLTKTLKHNLFLHSMTEGMLSAFFGAIGQKKHKEPLQMNWQLVPGSVGVCSVKKRVSNTGNEFNEIGNMIYQSDVDPTKQLNQRPGAQQQAYQAPVQQYAQPVQAPQQPLQQQTGWQPGAF